MIYLNITMFEPIYLKQMRIQLNQEIHTQANEVYWFNQSMHFYF